MNDQISLIEEEIDRSEKFADLAETLAETELGEMDENDDVDHAKKLEDKINEVYK